MRRTLAAALLAATIVISGAPAAEAQTSSPPDGWQRFMSSTPNSDGLELGESIQPLGPGAPDWANDIAYNLLGYLMLPYIFSSVGSSFIAPQCNLGDTRACGPQG